MRMKELPSSSFGEFIIQDLIVETYLRSPKSLHKKYVSNLEKRHARKEFEHE